MSNPRERSPDSVLPAWAPLLVLGAAAACLAYSWDRLPAWWVVHWGVGGVPNGWARRRPGAVFGPLVFALAPVGLFEAFATFYRRHGPQDPERRPVVLATIHLLRLTSTSFATFIALLALALPFRWPIPPQGMLLVALGLIGGAMGIGIRRVSSAMKHLSKTTQDERLRGYSGLIYRNPEDPRLWVPKLLGPGLTINFAHRWAWPVALLLMGGPLAIAAVLVVITLRR